jgi:pyruvate dehydrogenase E2 component (dihydrolipoamide acetyltransferase)
VAREFLLPDPGEGIHEAEILEIHVSPGDEVKDGDPLFSVETDKAVVDIPASFDGEIADVTVEVGDVASVGSVLLTYTPLGERALDEEPAAETETGSQEERVSKGAEKTSQQVRQRPVPASPATRSLARRLGVDLHEIEGSGPEGRIEPGDVEAAAGEEEEEEERPVRHQEESEVAEERITWIALRGVRRASARQMAKSWREIPHVTHHDVADITELERLRQDHAREIEGEGGKLSLTVFLVKAVAAALAEHPRFNASIDVENERIALKEQVNVGVAVDTDEGLVVPVIKDVAAKSMAEIAVELPALAQRMRDGDRSLEDFEDGTFTVTNPGGIGGTSFEPIINHPEVAILGAAQARRVPTYLDGEEELVARIQLPLVLAFDHRVNDGADAARFMKTVKGLLEDPAELALRI